MTERDLSDATEACGMLSAWIRDYGHLKEPAFIADLRTVLDSHAALRHLCVVMRQFSSTHNTHIRHPRPTLD